MKTFRKVLLLSILLFPAVLFSSELPGGACLKCHTRIGDKVATLWKDDVHAHAGIACADCHRGNPKKDDNILAKKAPTGFKGKFTAREIVELCGGCHANAEFMKTRDPLLPTDQWAKYKTSHHGKLLLQGDQKVAQCVSCHGNHGVREVNDVKSPVFASNVPQTCAKCHADRQYMIDYPISTKQYEEYAKSVHGQALLEKKDVRGAPACNDCHGNHGATPPGVGSITNICGTCHAYNAELFLESPMASAFQEKSLADCIACHGKHEILHTSDSWIGDEPGDLCRKCHKKGDGGADLAVYLAETLGTFTKDFEATKEMLHDAENKGMDVTEGEDHLQAARQASIQARTAIHAFSRPILDEKIGEAKKSQEAALEVAKLALVEHENRRKGLAVSTVLLLLLTLGIGFTLPKLPPK